MLNIEYYCFVVPKLLLDFKYKGGIKQFKIHLSLMDNYSYKEDNDICSVRLLTVEEAFKFILFTTQFGLDYDSEEHTSDDFTIVSWIGMLWEVDWLDTDNHRYWLRGSN